MIQRFSVVRSQWQQQKRIQHTCLEPQQLFIYIKMPYSANLPQRRSRVLGWGLWALDNTGGFACPGITGNVLTFIILHHWNCIEMQLMISYIIIGIKAFYSYFHSTANNISTKTDQLITCTSTFHTDCSFQLWIAVFKNIYISCMP